MNLILFSPDNYIDEDRIKLNGRQAKHIQEIHRAQVGDRLSVGLINEQMGEGEVLAINDAEVELKVSFHQPPPKPLPLKLIMALPRPNVFKRSLISATSLGVKDIHILHFNRVEKSLWQSSALAEDVIHEQLVLGLEQAKDTVLPNVHFHKRFRPFVEDELPLIADGSQKLVAHPGSENTAQPTQENVTLVIGPEGGLVPFEVEKLAEIGFQSIHLGERILRVEAAIPAFIAKLFL